MRVDDRSIVMRKSAQISRKQLKRKQAKVARKTARREQRAEQHRKGFQKCRARLKLKGMVRLREAAQTLLEGAKRAGVDIQGRIDKRGIGSLTVSDRVYPGDVERARLAVDEMARENEQSAKEIGLI